MGYERPKIQAPEIPVNLDPHFPLPSRFRSILRQPADIVTNCFVWDCLLDLVPFGSDPNGT